MRASSTTTQRRHGFSKGVRIVGAGSYESDGVSEQASSTCERVFGMNETNLDHLVGRLEGVVNGHEKHIDRINAAVVNLETKIDTNVKGLSARMDTHAATTITAVDALKAQVAKQGFINGLLIWVGSILATAGVQLGVSALKKLF